MAPSKPTPQASPDEVRPLSVPYSLAVQQVRIAAERLALLHLAFAETLVEEFGAERGRQLVAKAIKRYGRDIGTAVREGVQAQGLSLDPANYGAGTARDLPEFGMHDRIEEFEEKGRRLIRSYGCVLADVWRRRGRSDLGRLYCYVDPAKYMAFNPDFKLVHLKSEPDGDPYCEFELCRTRDEDKRLFASDDPGWVAVDRPDCGRSG